MTTNDVSDLFHCDVLVDDENGTESIISLAQLVRPEWKDHNVKVKVISKGVTNTLFGCHALPKSDEIILFRVYRKEAEFPADRKREMETFSILHKAGCAPKILATFVNGICYDYVPGVTLDNDALREEEIYKLIAHEMAKMHCIRDNNRSSPSTELFMRLKKYISLIPDQFEVPRKEIIAKSSVMSRSEFMDEANHLESVLSSIDIPIVLSHNDLHPENIVYNKELKKIYFVDYEHVMYTNLPFDIANHLCEFADESYQITWIREYLEARSALLGKDKTVTDKDVERMNVMVNKFALVTHLFWGAWFFVRACHSTEDKDYIKRAECRLNEYWKHKDEFLALKIPE